MAPPSKPHKIKILKYLNIIIHSNPFSSKTEIKREIGREGAVSRAAPCPPPRNRKAAMRDGPAHSLACRVRAAGSAIGPQAACSAVA